MKYLFLLLLGLLGAATSLRAQAIRFENDSLKDVFARARQQNKAVFVVLPPPPPPANLPPAILKRRSESGLNAPTVAAALNKDFLNKELAFGTRENAAFSRKYAVSQWPTYLYFGPDGSLLYRRSGNASSELRYLDDIKAFRQAQAAPDNFSRLQQEYSKGNWSVDFLRRYIAKHRELGLAVAPDLLDAYVELLPVKALNQASEVVFILENGPVIGSKAHKLTHLNMQVYDSLYRALPLPKRVAINKAIISNTMTQAIATKNRPLANQGADFARNSWTGNYQRGMVAYETNMLQFYRATQDTTSYLRAAVSFYERTYFNLPADSVEKAVAALKKFRQDQAVNQRALVDIINKTPPASSGTATGGVTAIAQPIAIGGPPASFLMELNNGAWAIYQTGTRNTQYLWPALQWSRRTVELDPTAPYHDTLAHLLYRLRFFSEAEAMQQQAIVLARQEKSPTAGLEQELQKIKQRTL